ncbi:protein GAMETOPHYTE DEFECTIVE 1-like [Bidens hawaiensis]|uniref:protein GAMETOPHYTE DEFECTIVE 1-like n=1 Tax=Bidens hawaiensis TaxID=980011 RepID=UPI00404B4936
MAFFDLNIPYTESTKHNSTTAKSTRLKLTIKAMELGYSGVAYNRTITGVMSEADRCSIALFPLESVLKVSPSISNAVSFHRRVLNVPSTTPFRQYTRITVVVENPAQGACLNSGNPVLKSYNIVAVRPLKQEVFDLACKSYEVDIIAIDFSETRFRLKQPLIKAAIERGVCFEITYSGLLDAQLRRQMISNAKLLVDWTRGKNIIFSSAAASVTEFRGPYDVANLACLLGFSMEGAKVSVSKTCRTLLENSLRKKKFHKEAIKAELISSNDDGFDDWLKWDPISSGEGDLQLDDMAKSFADSNKEPKTVNKAIDFVSVINELPSHGLQITDMVTETKLDSNLHDSHEKDRLLKVGNCDISSKNENLETLASVEADETCSMIIDEPEQQNLSLKVRHEDMHEEIAIVEKESESMCNGVPNPVVLVSFEDNCSSIQGEEANKLSPNASMFQPMPALSEAGISKTVLEEHMSDTKEACLPEEVLEEHISNTKDDVTATPVTSCFVSSCVSSNEKVLEENTSVIRENVSTAPSSVLANLRPHDELQINGCSSVVHEPLEDLSMEVNTEVKDDCHTNNLSAPQSSSIVHEPSEDVSMEVNVEVQDDSHMNNLSAQQSYSVVHEPSEDVSIEVNAEVKDDSHMNNLSAQQASSIVHEPSEDVSMEVNVEVKDDSRMSHLSAQESSSGRVRRKHGGSQRLVSFPFKSLLKRSHFKKTLKMRRKHMFL